jgi:hypothetical protein
MYMGIYIKIHEQFIYTYIYIHIYRLVVKENPREKPRGDNVNRIKGRVAGTFGAYEERQLCVMNYGKYLFMDVYRNKFIRICGYKFIFIYVCLSVCLFIYMYMYMGYVPIIITLIYYLRRLAQVSAVARSAKDLCDVLVLLGSHSDIALAGKMIIDVHICIYA